MDSMFYFCHSVHIYKYSAPQLMDTVLWHVLLSEAKKHLKSINPFRMTVRPRQMIQYTTFPINMIFISINGIPVFYNPSPQKL